MGQGAGVRKGVGIGDGVGIRSGIGVGVMAEQRQEWGWVQDQKGS